MCVCVRVCMNLFMCACVCVCLCLCMSLACDLLAALLCLLALEHQGHAKHAQAGKSCNQEENPHSHCVGQKCQY